MESLTSSLQNTAQQELRALEQFVAGRPGEDLQVPVTQGDIGGNLVSIASQGLYSDPRDVLREFAQNGVDANATQITIRFAGLNVAVIDDGDGMGFSELLLARRFGRSSKSEIVNVGFRGIGIYSAYQICERLVIVSQQAGSVKRWTMTFDFASMRQTLKKHKGDDRTLETALAPLIEANTTIAFDPVEPPSRGSTIALLENLDSEAYAELSDSESLQYYLWRTLPVPFDESFEHRKKIERYLSQNIPGFKTVAIRLLNDDTGLDQAITRSFPEGLKEPTFLDASWPPEEPQSRAKIWACMSDRKTLRPRGGIYFKKKGFTVGDGTELRAKFARRPAVYDWYVGEVYITDDAVVENAARNGFEKNAASRDLWSALDAPMAALLRQADEFSKKERATEVVRDVEATFRELIDTVHAESPYSSAVDTLEKIQRLISRLESQKIPTKDESYKSVRSKRDFLVRLIEQERQRLHSLIESATSTVPQDTETSAAALVSPLVLQEQQGFDLLSTFRESGCNIDQRLSDALTALDAVLRRTLPVSGEGSYGAVITSVRSALSRMK